MPAVVSLRLSAGISIERGYRPCIGSAGLCSSICRAALRSSPSAIISQSTASPWAPQTQAVGVLAGYIGAGSVLNRRGMGTSFASDRWAADQID